MRWSIRWDWYLWRVRSSSSVVVVAWVVSSVSVWVVVWLGVGVWVRAVWVAVERWVRVSVRREVWNEKEHIRYRLDITCICILIFCGGWVWLWKNLEFILEGVKGLMDLNGFLIFNQRPKIDIFCHNFQFIKTLQLCKENRIQQQENEFSSNWVFVFVFESTSILVLFTYFRIINAFFCKKCLSKNDLMRSTYMRISCLLGVRWPPLCLVLGHWMELLLVRWMVLRLVQWLVALRSGVA